LGAIVALIFSPAGIILGYYLNDYLAREKLQIVSLELLPDYMPIEFEKDNLITVYECWIYDALPYNYRSQIDPIFEDHNPLHVDQIEPFRNGLTKVLISIENNESIINEVINYLENYRPNEPQTNSIFDIYQISNLFMISMDGNLSQDERATIMKGILLLQRSMINAKLIISSIVEELINHKPQRSGYLCIRVGVVNRGNTDGLLNGVGKLRMVNENESVILKGYKINDNTNQYFPVTYEKIQRRSIVTLDYYVDELNSTAEACDILSQAIINKSLSQIVVELSDIQENTIDSKTYTLPQRDQY